MSQWRSRLVFAGCALFLGVGGWTRRRSDRLDTACRGLGRAAVLAAIRIRDAAEGGYAPRKSLRPQIAVGSLRGAGLDTTEAALPMGATTPSTMAGFSSKLATKVPRPSQAS